MKRITAMIAVLAIVICMIPMHCFAISPAESDTITELILEQKDMYPEGMIWTARTPAYAYTWGFKGSLIAMSGCSAFAAILQDTVFGPIRESEPSWQRVNANCLYKGMPENSAEYSWSNLYPGDIIRFDGHSVVVLTKGETVVTVVEGNYGGTVHWGREISRTTIEQNARFIITRYDKGRTMFSLSIPPKQHWSYDPIIWGIDEGITDNNLTNNTDKIDCTRAEMIYCLWLAMQKPQSSTETVFTDVPSISHPWCIRRRFQARAENAPLCTLR